MARREVLSLKPSPDGSDISLCYECLLRPTIIPQGSERQDNRFNLEGHHSSWSPTPGRLSCSIGHHIDAVYDRMGNLQHLTTPTHLAPNERLYLLPGSRCEASCRHATIVGG